MSDVNSQYGQETVLPQDDAPYTRADIPASRDDAPLTATQTPTPRNDIPLATADAPTLEDSILEAIGGNAFLPIEDEDNGEEQSAEAVVLTPQPQEDMIQARQNGAPMWWIAGLLALIAVLAGAAIVLLVQNGRLQKRLKAALIPERSRTDGAITRVRVGKLHAQGAREYQQDCFAVSDAALLESHGVLAVVADGMGGLRDGDKVSIAAVESAMDTFVMMQGKGTPEQTLLTLAHQIVHDVNELLGPDGYRQSGSTLAMGIVRNNMFSFLSVGDSHIYLLRDGVLTLLNREHVYRNELTVRGINGEIALSQIDTDDRAGGLTSYLGMGALKYVDMPVEPVTLRTGDRLVLMSDGVYNALETQELSSALDGDPQEAAMNLGEIIAAKRYANQDNYTAVILECI